MTKTLCVLCASVFHPRSAFRNVHRRLFPAFQVLREIVHHAPVEVLVHVAEAVALAGQEEGIVSPEERIALAKRHFRMEIQLHGERQGLPEMRKHIAWYMHGLRGASRFREEINTLEGCEQVLAALDRFLEEQQDAR